MQHLAHLAGGDGGVVLFLAYTGLRWGEMAALRVKDLDVLRRRVNVDQAVTEVGRDPATVGKMWANRGQTEKPIMPITRTAQ